MAERLLLLLRHAKAERARSGEADHERALSERGRRDAAVVGETIARHSIEPDLAIVSTAKRTLETFDIAAGAMERDIEVRQLRSLFQPGSGYLPIIRAEGGDATRLLVVGHNPYVQDAAVALTSDRSSRDARAIADHVPTAALIVLGFEGEWSSLSERAMRLISYRFPENGR